uniref:Uncharacterized protein n=1 Tax=Schistosoma japonicum TaxID=6182 RepID=Q5C3H6_SCHJA|nr:unknown [Schistosoma japonicum]
MITKIILECKWRTFKKAHEAFIISRDRTVGPNRSKIYGIRTFAHTCNCTGR